MIKQDYILDAQDGGYKIYYYKDKLHRLNGPAEIWPNGNRFYWVNNRYITGFVQEGFRQKLLLE